MKIYTTSDTNKIIDEINNNKIAILETDTQIAIVSKKPSDIYRLKQRCLSKKLILFINDLSCVKDPNFEFLKLANKFWPGKLTIIYNGQSYRMPNNKLILNIIKSTGPLFSSSANISGLPPIKKCSDAIELFKEFSDEIIIVEGKQNDPNPSTVYNLDTNQVIREGLISKEDIEHEIKS